MSFNLTIPIQLSCLTNHITCEMTHKKSYKCYIVTQLILHTGEKHYNIDNINMIGS